MGISEALNNDKKVRLLRVLFYGFLVVITGGLSLLALISLRPSNLNPLDLQVGNVAPHDILSPYALTYESTILTQQQKEAAGQAVAPVYTSPDTGLARQQVAQLRATLNFISKTRTNDALTFESKLLDLETLDTASLQPATANYLLTISDAQWQSVQQEAITVLQQVMRNPIRETQIDDIRRNIPNLVSFSMSEEQAQVVSELVSLFVLPNSFYSEEITQSRRDAAIESVPPVFRSFVKGETVVLRGKVITQADAEALQQLGLLSQGDENTYFLTASSVILIALVLLIIVIYRLPGLLFQPKRS